jgi:glycopeptide antibiotics resistance protein
MIEVLEMKSLSKIVFFIYVLVLLWLVLFKTSIDMSSVLAGYHMSSLNLVPFTGRLSEMVENFVVFIPLGLLLSVNFKKVIFWQSLIVVFVFSLAVETIQYVLAIGISDITDVITNTFGGLFGLIIYRTIAKNHADSKKIDRFIAVLIALLIVVFLFLRFFVFRVRY